ncbi:MAG: hypothetical protein IKP03_02155 [Fibrobacter sp.]|nr:hypothetical protein [Fibrobacter sp.]
MDCILLIFSILTNIGLIIVSIFVIRATNSSTKATKESVETTKKVQTELTRQRFAYYDTIVRNHVQITSSNTKFETKTEIFQHFLILAVVRKDNHYMSRIISENGISDSKEFLEYVCRVADEDLSQHMFLIQ